MCKWLRFDARRRETRKQDGEDEFLSETCLFSGLLSCSRMLWSSGLLLMWAVQSLNQNLGRGLAWPFWAAPPVPWLGKALLWKRSCVQSKWEEQGHSTRDPCRHQPALVLSLKTLAFRRLGCIKEKQKWDSNGFSSEGHPPPSENWVLGSPGLAWWPAILCIPSRSGLGGKSHWNSRLLGSPF